MHRTARSAWLAPLALAACSWFASASTSTPTSAAMPPAAPVSRVAPTPSDATPTRLGSPGGSLAQRPAWRVADRGYAPALAEDAAASLFAIASTATQPRAALEGELLACRIDVKFEEIKRFSLRPHKWAAADLLLVFGFGSGAATTPGAISVFGVNQSNHAHFVVPAARLGPGDAIDLLVNDRDRLIARDFIDRVAIAFAGSTPLVATTPVSTVVCRVVEGEALASEVLRRLWDVDDALARWRRLEPDVRSGTAACSTAPEVIETTSALAGVLGWDDARVLARLDAAAATETTVMQSCAQRFAAFVAGLDPVGAPATLGRTDVGVRVLDGSCAAAAMARVEATGGRSAGGRCTFALELTNRAATPLELPVGAAVHPAWDVITYDARGRSLQTQAAGPARRIAASSVGRVDFITGDATAVTTFGAVSNTAIASAPVLVELHERTEGGLVVRLRLPRLADR